MPFSLFLFFENIPTLLADFPVFTSPGKGSGMKLRYVVAAAVYVEISVGGRLSRHPLFQGFVLRRFICRDYYSKPFFVIS